MKGPRHGSPRFSGRGILAVFGLLGVLVTLGIMVLLVVRVLDGVGGSSAGDASDIDGLVTTVPAPSQYAERAEEERAPEKVPYTSFLNSLVVFTGT